MKKATDVGLQTWEADVTCGVWCQGGSVRWLKTDHPQYTDASDVWVRGDDAIAALESLRAELAECKDLLRIASDFVERLPGHEGRTAFTDRIDAALAAKEE